MWPWIQVMLGGAAGSLLRFLLADWIQVKQAGTFPWPVFSVNLIGCLLIGIIAALLQVNTQLNHWKLLLITGFLGGFTTYSSFALESLQLIQNKAWKEVVFYIGGTNLLGLICVYLGYQLMAWIK